MRWFTLKNGFQHCNGSKKSNGACILYNASLFGFLCLEFLPFCGYVLFFCFYGFSALLFDMVLQIEQNVALFSHRFCRFALVQNMLNLSILTYYILCISYIFIGFLLKSRLATRIIVLNCSIGLFLGRKICLKMLC